MKITSNQVRFFYYAYFLENFILEKLVEKEVTKDYRLYDCSYLLNEDNLNSLDSIKNNLKSENSSLFRMRNVSGFNIFGTLLEDLIREEKERIKIVYKANYDQYSRFNYMKAPGGEGLELIDKESLDRSGKVINFMVKSLGKNFLMGKELMNIALPININDERTMLEV